MILDAIKVLSVPAYLLVSGFFSLPAMFTAETPPKLEEVDSTTSQRDQTLLTLSKNPQTVDEGREYYTAYCMACHGPEGVEVDSPSNLFDKKWYHRAGPSGIEESIRKGVMEKGMPAWGEMIPDDQIQSLIAYLLSFQNTDATKT